MLIADSQVHIWAEDSPERPWTPGNDLHTRMGHRAKAIGYNELKNLMDGSGVDRVFIVPPTWDQDRNDMGLEAAEKYPDRFALMARVPLDNPEAGKRVLEQFQDTPGMKGTRLTFFRPEEATWLDDGTADWYWPLAQELKVPTMLHASNFKKQIAGVAEKFPDLKLMLDHLGVAGGTKDEACGPYVDETVALARYPNISVKISSVPAKTSAPYPYENMNRYVKKLVDAFGPARCYWGTDLSRILGFVGATYSQCVTHFTEHMDFLSVNDLDLIMGRALCEAVDWPIPAD